MYRTGLRMALNYADSGCEVVAEAESVSQAVELLHAKDLGIDLVLLDYYLPDGTGGDVIETAKKAFPDVKILLLILP